MRALGRRLTVTAVIAAMAAVGAGALTPVTATAAPISSCTGTTGTIIAVDFSHWGGPIVRGCDTADPAHGIELLTDEGFRTAGDNHDGPQFLCRIGNQAYDSGTQYPTPAQDPCIVTPPASAYWSYWLAPAGQNSWTYSQLGAYSEKPKKGEVELWIFGGTNIAGTQGLPTCSPASLRAPGSVAHCSPVGSGRTTPGHPEPKPKPTTHPATTHHPKSAASVGASATNPADQTRGSATTSPSGDAGSVTNSAAPTRPRSPSRAGSASATPTSAAAGSPSASGPQIIDAQPAAANTASHGSAVPLIIGVGLAAILAAGGGVTMWRRRQQSE